MDCHEYFKATSRRISFEYTLLAGVNDSPKQVCTPTVAEYFMPYKSCMPGFAKHL